MRLLNNVVLTVIELVGRGWLYAGSTFSSALSLLMDVVVGVL